MLGNIKAIVQLKSYKEYVFENLEINVTMCRDVIASLLNRLQGCINTRIFKVNIVRSVYVESRILSVYFLLAFV